MAHFYSLAVYRSTHVAIEGLPGGAEVVLDAGGHRARAFANRRGTATLSLTPPGLSLSGVTLCVRLGGRSVVLPFGRSRLTAGSIYRWIHL